MTGEKTWGILLGYAVKERDRLRAENERLSSGLYKIVMYISGIKASGIVLPDDKAINEIDKIAEQALRGENDDNT